MHTLAMGNPVPDFSLPATGSQTIQLSALRGKHVVLFFYPKDCTSGCTLEGQQFRDHYAEFKKLNTEILGISRDTIALHEKFKAEQQFPFELLSDTQQTVCTLFGVLKEKMLYGKKVRGIERSTFLIGKTGVLVHEWRNVKVEGHAEEVLKTIQQLNL